MRFIIILSLVFTSLLSRENPFDSPFDRPKIEQENIPLLDIQNSKVFSLLQTTKKNNKNKNKKDINAKKTVIHNIKQEKKQNILPPIIIDETDNNVPDCIPICEIKKATPKKKNPKRKKRFKNHKKILKYKTIFKNYFLTAKSNNKRLKLYTKDKLICSKRYNNPKRVFFDFKKLQYFKSKTINLSNKFIKNIKFGSHHKFYRITLQSHKNYKIKKTSYGYLIY